MNLDEVLNPDEAKEEPDFSLATVGTVANDGITLVFDGASSSGGKKYRCNSSVRFSAGDRVRVKRDSGSYLIEYPIGAPMSRFPIPSGGTDGQVLVKDGSTPYAVKWSSSGGAVDRLGTGTFYIEMKTRTITPITTDAINLGSSTKQFADIYANGTLSLGSLGSKIGFFGKAPIAHQTMSATTTLAELINILVLYGLG